MSSRAPGIDNLNHKDTEDTEYLFTERCSLVPLSNIHIDHIFKLYRNPDVQQYLGGPLDDQNAFKKRFHETLQDKNSINWSVALKGCGDFMGMIAIGIHHDKQDYEVGFKFLPKFWGQGYSFEAIEASIETARERLTLQSIVAETQEVNLRCRRLLEKLAFSEERTLTRHGEKQIFYRLIF